MKKSFILSIFIAVFMTCCIPTRSEAFFYEISRFYSGISAPISGFLRDGRGDVQIMRNETDESYYVPITFSQIPYLFANSFRVSGVDSLKEKFTHKNIFIKILTFGNESSLRNLNNAHFYSNNLTNVPIFCYDKDKNAHLVAANSDACSMLFWGFSWFINSPHRFITTTILDFKVKEFSIIDIIPTAISYVVEVVCMLFNMTIGAIIAFFCHPLDSICSLFGTIYFSVCSIFNAIIYLIAGVYVAYKY